MLNGLDLFSGYGGAARALTGFVRTVAYCEIERGAQRILLRAMQKSELDTAPIWDDVRTLRRRHIAAQIDIITGGWPCTDISLAGRCRGLEGPESRLFWEIARLAREFRPKFLFLENSPNLLAAGYGFDEVLGELAAQGFDVSWGVLSAYDVGAPHIRERLWILAAHAESIGCPEGRPELKIWERESHLPGAAIRLNALLPTPTRMDCSDRKYQRQTNGKKVDTLPGAAHKLSLILPTPLSRDWKDGLNPGEHGRNSPSVAVAVAVAKAGHQGYLNPQFVAWMMGLPAAALEPLEESQFLPAATVGLYHAPEKHLKD